MDVSLWLQAAVCCITFFFILLIESVATKFPVFIKTLELVLVLSQTYKVYTEGRYR
jgi:hypothetical protein